MQYVLGDDEKSSRTMRDLHFTNDDLAARQNSLDGYDSLMNRNEQNRDVVDGGQFSANGNEPVMTVGLDDD